MALYAAETILYLLFLGMDIFGIGDTTPIKFLSILLLTLSVFDFREKTVSIAMIFTALADVFLLVLNRFYAAGILCFLVVQTCYAVRIRKAGDLPRHTAVYALPPVEALAGAYILLFAVNLIQAVRLAHRCPSRKWKLFAAGLALFFCCDLCVGIHNLPNLGGPALHRFAQFAMWGCYLPGQCLIRASAYPPLRKETVQ